jgi:nucleoside 2-deoxyribosyltransferase
MPIKVFYAQPVDFIPSAHVRESIAHLEQLVCGLPVEIVTPYVDEEPSSLWLLNRTGAQKIVDRDYSALDTCNIFLADLSKDDRQAIGMIFEMAYAQSKGKPIMVYTGSSSISSRVWIRAAADFCCQTWPEVRFTLLKHLESPRCGETTGSRKTDNRRANRNAISLRSRDENQLSLL